MVLPLKFAEEREQGGDLRGVAFVHAMQSDERTEDDQYGTETFRGFEEPLPIQSFSSRCSRFWCEAAARSSLAMFMSSCRLRAACLQNVSVWYDAFKAPS